MSPLELARSRAQEALAKAKERRENSAAAALGQFQGLERERGSNLAYSQAPNRPAWEAAASKLKAPQAKSQLPQQRSQGTGGGGPATIRDDLGSRIARLRPTTQKQQAPAAMVQGNTSLRSVGQGGRLQGGVAHVYGKMVQELGAHSPEERRTVMELAMRRVARDRAAARPATTSAPRSAPSVAVARATPPSAPPSSLKAQPRPAMLASAIGKGIKIEDEPSKMTKKSEDRLVTLLRHLHHGAA